MSASAALRRLSAVVTLIVVGFTGALALAPAASASAPLGAAANFQTRQAGNPNGETLIEQRINQAANVAISHIGDPYRYGAAGPHAFDCSGLTLWSYTHSHMNLPRTAAGQYAAVRHLIKAHMVRGDLVFFHDSNGHVYHVGMFLYWNPQGRAVIIHAPHSGTVVHRQAVWTTAWYAGTRRP
jgi:cell wall-associated NlpC family hydrolase